MPVGSVPGIKLDSAQNALRSRPEGKRSGQATNPGRSSNLGLSARHATSTPETIDWRRKLAASSARDPTLSRDPRGGRKRRLVHVAPATAARPTGRSAGDQPEIMSQNARKHVARRAAARARPGEASPVKRKVRSAQTLRRANAQAARSGAPGESGHADRWRVSTSEILDRWAASEQSYHVPRNGGRMAPIAGGCTASSTQRGVSTFGRGERKVWEGRTSPES